LDPAHFLCVPATSIPLGGPFAIGSLAVSNVDESRELKAEPGGALRINPK
jgi:hypothetical protein